MRPALCCRLPLLLRRRPSDAPPWRRSPLTTISRDGEGEGAEAEGEGAEGRGSDAGPTEMQRRKMKTKTKTKNCQMSLRDGRSDGAAAEAGDEDTVTDQNRARTPDLSFSASSDTIHGDADKNYVQMQYGATKKSHAKPPATVFSHSSDAIHGDAEHSSVHEDIKKTYVKPDESFSHLSVAQDSVTEQKHVNSHSDSIHEDTEKNHKKPDARVSSSAITHEDTQKMEPNDRPVSSPSSPSSEQNHAKPDARVSHSAAKNEDTQLINNVKPYARMASSSSSSPSPPLSSSSSEQNHAKPDATVSTSATIIEDTQQINNVKPYARLVSSSSSPSPSLSSSSSEQNHAKFDARASSSATTSEGTEQMNSMKPHARLVSSSSPSPSPPSSSSSGAGNEESTTEQTNLEEMVREWASLRRTRLTASVFAFAIGFWEGRRVQLWKEKIGILEPFQGNLSTNWGTLKEAPAIQQYIKLTDNKVHHQLFKSYPQGTSMPDWMGASPDGLVYSRSAFMLENGGILEVKCPFNRGRPDIGVPWPYVPYYYMPQAQGLMEIFDRNWMDFYVWTLNGSSIYRIDRNPDLWELMLTALNDFWWGHVMPAKHVLSKEGGDADLRRFKPGPHHALFLTIANKCKVLADKSPLLLHDRNPRLVR